MAAGTKMVSNGSLCSKKSLGMTSRFELPHRLLTLAGRLMRILGSIVQAFVLAMFHTR